MKDKKHLVMNLQTWYNISAEANRTPGVLLLNAVNCHNILLWAKRPLCVDSRPAVRFSNDGFHKEGAFSMTPNFPQNLKDYAPWVARYGLYVPYGECQCGCGQRTALSRDNEPKRGLKKGCPVRFIRGHRIPEPRRSPSQMTPEGYTDGLAKTCVVCNESKPATTEYFSPSELGRFGLSTRCKGCANDVARVYRKANPGVAAKRTRKWRAANRDRRAEYMRVYRETHREIFVAIGHRRRARQRKAGGSHTATDIKRQYKAQKGKCYYCGEKVGNHYHVDHVVPLARGGSDGPENLVIACVPCNKAKSDKLPHEWPEGGRLL